MFGEFSMARHRQSEQIGKESSTENDILSRIIGDQPRIGVDFSQAHIFLHPTGHLQWELPLFDVHSSEEKQNLSSFTNGLEIGEKLMYLYVHYQGVKEKSSARGEETVMLVLFFLITGQVACHQRQFRERMLSVFDLTTLN